jgi:uncharacterized protein YjbJ (UPF0337 family)
MSDKHVDDAKGRVKQAAGSLSGDRRLKHDGKADQAKASVKDKSDKIVDTLTGRGKIARTLHPSEPRRSNRPNR